MEFLYSLREKMAKSIPPRWPDDVQSQIYPKYAEPHGALKKVSSLGAYYSGGRVEIVLALEHERSAGRLKVAFSSAGLELLDFKGPDYPATLRLLPKGGTRFEAQREGVKESRFDFVRKGGRVSALKTNGLELRRKE